jgi:hypothetical protein
MENKKTAAELYSAAIMEASAALTAAGFRLLSVTGMDAYALRECKLGQYQPDSVRLSFMVTKEPMSS